MPIYEYQCDGCRKVFEVYQRHTDPPPDGHSCGSTEVRRVLSNTSFVLKGSGWYATDYARPPAKGDGKEGEGTGGAEEGGKKDTAAEGGDGKPAAGDAPSPRAAADAAPGKKDGGTPSGGKSSGGKSSDKSGGGAGVG